MLHGRWEEGAIREAQAEAKVEQSERNQKKKKQKKAEESDEEEAGDEEKGAEEEEDDEDDTLRTQDLLKKDLEQIIFPPKNPKPILRSTKLLQSKKKNS